MSYSLKGAVSGECRDAATDFLTMLRTTDCTVVSTAARVVSPGTRAVLHPTATNAAKAITPAGVTSSIASTVVVFQGYVGLSTTPSSAIGLISNDTQGDDRFVRINTSNKIELYDNAGTQFGPTSRGTISTTGMTHFMFVMDTASMTSSGGMWLTLILGGVWEYSFRANITGFLPNNLNDICWGEWLPAATNRGADLYTAHCTLRTSTLNDVADAIYRTRYPLLQAVGGASLPPTAAGTHTAWVGTFADVDEYPNDGDVGSGGTEITTNVSAAKETFTYSASNPTSSSDTIPHVVMRGALRGVGVKNVGKSLLRDGSGNESSIAWVIPSTATVGTYHNDLARNTAPDGTAWVYTDFDLSGGVSTLQFGVEANTAGTVNEAVSSLPGPEIWKYQETMLPGRYLYQNVLMAGGFL